MSLRACFASQGYFQILCWKRIKLCTIALLGFAVARTDAGLQVWRGGHDHFFHGEGPERERWVAAHSSLLTREESSKNGVLAGCCTFLSVMSKRAFMWVKPGEQEHIKLHDWVTAMGTCG